MNISKDLSYENKGHHETFFKWGEKVSQFMPLIKIKVIHAYLLLGLSLIDAM